MRIPKVIARTIAVVLALSLVQTSGITGTVNTASSSRVSHEFFSAQAVCPPASPFLLTLATRLAARIDRSLSMWTVTRTKFGTEIVSRFWEPSISSLNLAFIGGGPRGHWILAVILLYGLLRAAAKFVDYRLGLERNVLTVPTPAKDALPELIGETPFGVTWTDRDRMRQRYRRNSSGRLLQPLIELRPESMRTILDGGKYKIYLLERYIQQLPEGFLERPDYAGLIAWMIPRTSSDIDRLLENHPPRGLLSLTNIRGIIKSFKLDIDRGQVIFPAAGVQALFDSWAGVDGKYTLLLEDVNRILVNPENNPRRKAATPIHSINEINHIELLSAPLGSASSVLEVDIHLEDRWVLLGVNLPLDLTESAATMAQSQETVAQEFRENPNSAMEVFATHWGMAQTARGKVRVPIEVGEWIDGDTIVMNQHGQWMIENVSPGPTSVIWNCIARTQTLYSRIDGATAQIAGFSLSNVDLMIRRDPDGTPRALAVASRQRTPGDRALIAIEALTLRAQAQDRADYTVWWDNPGQALQAMEDGLFEQLNGYPLTPESPETLRLAAHHLAQDIAREALTVLPSLIHDPEPLHHPWEYPWDFMDRRMATSVLRHAQPALEAFVRDDSTSRNSGSIREMLGLFSTGIVPKYLSVSKIAHPQHFPDLYRPIASGLASLTKGQVLALIAVAIVSTALAIHRHLRHRRLTKMIAERIAAQVKIPTGANTNELLSQFSEFQRKIKPTQRYNEDLRGPFASPNNAQTTGRFNIWNNATMANRVIDANKFSYEELWLLRHRIRMEINMAATWMENHRIRTALPTIEILNALGTAIESALESKKNYERPIIADERTLQNAIEASDFIFSTLSESTGQSVDEAVQNIFASPRLPKGIRRTKPGSMNLQVVLSMNDRRGPHLIFQQLAPPGNLTSELFPATITTADGSEWTRNGDPNLLVRDPDHDVIGKGYWAEYAYAPSSINRVEKSDSYPMAMIRDSPAGNVYAFGRFLDHWYFLWIGRLFQRAAVRVIAPEAEKPLWAPVAEALMDSLEKAVESTKNIGQATSDTIQDLSEIIERGADNFVLAHGQEVLVDGHFVPIHSKMNPENPDSSTHADQLKEVYRQVAHRMINVFVIAARETADPLGLGWGKIADAVLEACVTAHSNYNALHDGMNDGYVIAMAGARRNVQPTNLPFDFGVDLQRTLNHGRRLVRWGFSARAETYLREDYHKNEISIWNVAVLREIAEVQWATGNGQAESTFSEALDMVERLKIQAAPQNLNTPFSAEWRDANQLGIAIRNILNTHLIDLSSQLLLEKRFQKAIRVLRNPNNETLKDSLQGHGAARINLSRAYLGAQNFYGPAGLNLALRALSGEDGETIDPSLQENPEALSLAARIRKAQTNVAQAQHLLEARPKAELPLTSLSGFYPAATPLDERAIYLPPHLRHPIRYVLQPVLIGAIAMVAVGFWLFLHPYPHLPIRIIPLSLWDNPLVKPYFWSLCIKSAAFCFSAGMTLWSLARTLMIMEGFSPKISDALARLSWVAPVLATGCWGLAVIGYSNLLFMGFSQGQAKILTALTTVGIAAVGALIVSPWPRTDPMPFPMWARRILAALILAALLFKWGSMVKPAPRPLLRIAA